MRPLCAAVLCLALSAAPALAAPATFPAGSYTLDPNHCQVIFQIRHMGLSTFYGRLGKISGRLQADPAKPAEARLDVTIDMTDVSTHVPALDDELKADFFVSQKFPTATFKATKIEATGEQTGKVTGDLTIKGVTRPLTLDVTFSGSLKSPMPPHAQRLGFDASATINRADFGLTDVPWSAGVGNDVRLLIEAEFEKAQ